MMKVAVFGLGRSGLSALRFLSFLGKEITVVNQGAPESWQGLDEFKNLTCYSQDDERTGPVLAAMDAIILSPGIPREHEVLKEALEKGVDIINEIELALEHINLPLIGITGTNGKTTTTTICGEIFKASNVEAFIGGNIGVPFCDCALAQLRDGKKYDVAVLELSSFQLESIPSLRPKKAAILNVYPNHGERYENVEDYALAKMNIAKNMSKEDCLFLCENEDYLRREIRNVKCPVVFLKAEIEHDLREALKEYDLSKFKLLGIHNLSNLLFAISLTKDMGATKEGIQKVIDSFCGVEYRLQFVPGPYSFAAFNDAKSTNWDATLVALDSFFGRRQELWLIIGGQPRGRGDSISPYLNEIREKVGRILLIGKSGLELKEEIEGKIPVQYLETLEQVRDYVVGERFNGDLLFSPAFPSFDQFKDYAHRGRVFNELFGDIKKSSEL